MTSEKQYFTVNEALEDILGVLENEDYDGQLCDLHHEVFNTDYYIIGTSEAKQALTQYGVFEALEEIQEYEDDHFGKVLTDLSSPERVANMLYYLKGHEAIERIQNENDFLDTHWNEKVNNKIRQSLIDTINMILEDYVSILHSLEELVKKEQKENLTAQEKIRYIQLVNILQENGVDIPFNVKM